jgi:hypothetical protein
MARFDYLDMVEAMQRKYDKWRWPKGEGKGKGVLVTVTRMMGDRFDRKEGEPETWIRALVRADVVDDKGVGYDDEVQGKGMVVRGFRGELLCALMDAATVILSEETNDDACEIIVREKTGHFTDDEAELGFAWGESVLIEVKVVDSMS